MVKLFTEPEAPEKLASLGQVIEISEEVSQFPRLSDALHRELEPLDDARVPDGWAARPVVGSLTFDFADAQADDVVATIEASASVPLVCQRCLETFDQPIAVATSVRFAGNDERAESDDVEAWELDEPRLRPIDLVDELLVMTLPFAAKHADSADCKARDGEPAAATTRVRPFADLKSMMAEDKSSAGSRDE